MIDARVLTDWSAFTVPIITSWNGTTAQTRIQPGRRNRCRAPGDQHQVDAQGREGIEEPLHGAQSAASVANAQIGDREHREHLAARRAPAQRGRRLSRPRPQPVDRERACCGGLLPNGD